MDIRNVQSPYSNNTHKIPLHTTTYLYLLNPLRPHHKISLDHEPIIIYSKVFETSIFEIFMI